MFVLRRVEGVSMAPTYGHGKLVLAWRWRRPKVGDVVIVRHHRLELIKRIHQLEDNKVFLLGDNPQESTDSRHYGWLPARSILAVVIGGRRNVETA
jgi:nickel-type superoxide dismutase maturation protease